MRFVSTMLIAAVVTGAFVAGNVTGAQRSQIALAAPLNGTVEIAGPDRAPFAEIVARYLKSVGDARPVVTDRDARYYGGRIEEKSLVPLAGGCDQFPHDPAKRMSLITHRIPGWHGRDDLECVLAQPR